MENKNDKRVLNIELNDEVKKVSITGLGSDEKVVMRQELDENELDMVTGGGSKFSNVTDSGACAMDLPHGEVTSPLLESRKDELVVTEGHAGGPVHTWV